MFLCVFELFQFFMQQKHLITNKIVEYSIFLKKYNLKHMISKEIVKKTQKLI